MAQAQGSRRTVGYIAETTPGTTPASPQFVGLEYVDFDLALNTENLSDPSIRADRQTSYSRRGNASTDGTLSVVMCPDNFDTLLEAALQGTWTSNQLKIGTTQRSFAFEEGFDFGTNQRYRVFNGVVVNTLAMEVTTDALVTASFGLLGHTVTEFGATSVDANGYTVPATKDKFYHEDGTFNEGGAPVGYLSSIAFELTNNAVGNRGLGTTGFRDITSNKVGVTGSVTALFESVDLYNKYRNDVDSSLQFTLNANAESLTFFFPRIKYTSGTITSTGDAGVTVEMAFEALYDNTAGNTLVITRV